MSASRGRMAGHWNGGVIRSMLVGLTVVLVFAGVPTTSWADDPPTAPTTVTESETEPLPERVPHRRQRTVRVPHRRLRTVRRPPGLGRSSRQHSKSAKRNAKMHNRVNLPISGCPRPCGLGPLDGCRYFDRGHVRTTAADPDSGHSMRSRGAPGIRAGRRVDIDAGERPRRNTGGWCGRGRAECHRHRTDSRGLHHRLRHRRPAAEGLEPDLCCRANHPEPGGAPGRQ